MLSFTFHLLTSCSHGSFDPSLISVILHPLVFMVIIWSKFHFILIHYFHYLSRSNLKSIDSRFIVSLAKSFHGYGVSISFKSCSRFHLRHLFILNLEVVIVSLRTFFTKKYIEFIRFIHYIVHETLHKKITKKITFLHKLTFWSTI